MITKNIQRFIGIAGFLLICQSAFATPTITAHYNGGANFGAGNVGYGSGKIWPNPSHPSGPFHNSDLLSVGIGGDNFTSTVDHYNWLDAGGSFNAWCVDITHYLHTGNTTYDLGGKGQLTSIFGASRVADLLDLANEHYLDVNSKTTSAAFQLAIWAISFGTPDALGDYSLNSDTFKTSSGITGGALAQTWLNHLDTDKKTGAFNVIYLYNSNPRLSQNLIVFAPVPEPATYAMVLGGLGMLWLVRRKKAAGAAAVLIA